MPTVAGMGTRDMDMEAMGTEAMGIKAMDIKGRGSSSARASSSPSEPTGGLLGALSVPPVVMAPPPQVSVEPTPLPPQYWYYCDAAQAYYPYVQECPGEWRPVWPTPPG